MIIKDEPIAAYHAQGPKTLSKTRLMDFRANGAPWWKLRYIDRAIPDRDSKAMVQGRALDVVLTEGFHAYGKQFAVKPDKLHLGSTDGKAWKASVGDKEVISYEDSLILGEAVECVRSSPYNALIEACQAQVSIRRELTDEGLPGITVQSRPDFLNPEAGIYIDLKKTRDFTGFGKDAINLGYHIQASLTGALLAREGVTISDYYLLAVEWDRGARCHLYRIPDEILSMGWRDALGLTREIADRHASGDWTDKPPQVATELDVPGWLLARMQAA